MIYKLHLLYLNVIVEKKQLKEIIMSTNDTNLNIDKLIINKIKKEEDLFSFINNRIDKISNYNLLLGAGASVTSGVLSGQQLVEKWRKEVFYSYPENKDIECTKEVAQTFFREKYGREYDADREYSFLFKEKYHLPAQRRNFVETTIKAATPNIGYRYLANLVRANYFNTIFTTNFDDLIEQSLISANLELKPIMCSHDASISSIPVVSNRPKIIKLHGDFLYDDIKTTIAETNRLEENMQNKFEEFLKNFGLIVIGYSGCDDSIMDILERLIKKDGFLDGGLYWCTRNLEEVEKNFRLKKLLLNDKAYIVKIDGFDEFFAKLNHSITDTNFDKDPFKKEKNNIFPLECIEKIIETFPNNDLIRSDCENYTKNYKTTLTQALEKYSSKYSSKEKSTEDNNLINLSKLTEDPELKSMLSTLDQHIKEEDTPENIIKIIEEIEKKSYNFSDVRLFNFIEKLKLEILKKKNDITEIIRTWNELKSFNEEKKFIYNEAYIELAQCYIDKQKWDDAYKILTEAISKNTYEDVFYLLLADVQYEKYKTESSRDENIYEEIKNNYIKSINLNPSVRYNRAYQHFTDFLCSCKLKKVNENDFQKIIIEPFIKQNIYDVDYPYVIAQKAIYDYNNSSENPFTEIDKLYETVKENRSFSYKASAYRNYLNVCLETKRLDLFERCKTEMPFTFKKTRWYIKMIARFELSIKNNLETAINILCDNLYLDSDNELLLQLLRYKIYNGDYEYVEQNLDKLHGDDLYEIKTTLYEHKNEVEALYNISKENYYNSSQEFYDKMKFSYHLLICQKFQECYDLLNDYSIQSPILEINYELARIGNDKNPRLEKLSPIYEKYEGEEKAAACVLLNKKEEAISILKNLISKDYETYYRIKTFPVFKSIKDKLL